MEYGRISSTKKSELRSNDDRSSFTLKIVNTCHPWLTIISSIALNISVGQHYIETGMTIINRHAQDWIRKTNKCFQIRPIEQTAIDQRMLCIVIGTDIEISKVERHFSCIAAFQTESLPLQGMNIDRRDGFCI